MSVRLLLDKDYSSKLCVLFTFVTIKSVLINLFVYFGLCLEHCQSLSFNVQVIDVLFHDTRTSVVFLMVSWLVWEYSV